MKLAPTDSVAMYHGVTLRRLRMAAPLKRQSTVITFESSQAALRRLRMAAPLKQLGTDGLTHWNTALRRLRMAAPLKRPAGRPDRGGRAKLSAVFGWRLR